MACKLSKETMHEGWQNGLWQMGYGKRPIDNTIPITIHQTPSVVRYKPFNFARELQNK